MSEVDVDRLQMPIFVVFGSALLMLPAASLLVRGGWLTVMGLCVSVASLGGVRYGEALLYDRLEECGVKIVGRDDSDEEW